jgi:hypothetical protein
VEKLLARQCNAINDLAQEYTFESKTDSSTVGNLSIESDNVFVLQELDSEDMHHSSMCQQFDFTIRELICVIT